MNDNENNNPTIDVLKETIVPFIEENTVIPVLSNSLRIEQIFQVDKELRELMKQSPEFYDEVRTYEQQLTKKWAEQIKYPMSDDHNLARVAQYRHIEKNDPDLPKIEYLKFINDRLLKLYENEAGYKDKVAELRARKTRLIFSETAQKLNSPREFPGGREDPLKLLAGLPLSIFITTSYSDFLERALEDSGKVPRTQICFWNGSKVGITPEHLPDPNYNPTPENPAVYHLFGLENNKDTLVISEDDYLNFLMTAAEELNSQDLYPSPLRLALPTARLMLLGYNLRDWDFRALFKFILLTRKTANKKPSIAIQLRPTLENKNYEASSLNFLERFFGEQNFRVAWTGTENFIYQLSDAWDDHEKGS
jgi:hypothetical protein